MWPAAESSSPSAYVRRYISRLALKVHKLPYFTGFCVSMCCKAWSQALRRSFRGGMKDQIAQAARFHQERSPELVPPLFLLLALFDILWILKEAAAADL